MSDVIKEGYVPRFRLTVMLNSGQDCWLDASEKTITETYDGLLKSLEGAMFFNLSIGAGPLRTLIRMSDVSAVTISEIPCAA